MKLDGHIISGELDQSNNEFVIQHVKHLDTVSAVEKNQLELLYHYLSKQDEADGHVVTLNDQVLVKLNQKEIDALLEDLEMIISKLNSPS